MLVLTLKNKRKIHLIIGSDENRRTMCPCFGSHGVRIAVDTGKTAMRNPHVINCQICLRMIESRAEKAFYQAFGHWPGSIAVSYLVAADWLEEHEELHKARLCRIVAERFSLPLFVQSAFPNS